LFPSDWLADAPYEDFDLGVLKAGKESEVYLVSRTGPTRTCLMAEKRFKPRLQRGFRNDYLYSGVWGEGTYREDRAIKNRTRFGQEVLQARWIGNEWTMLGRLHTAGVTVPPPVERIENGYRMAFIGDGDQAAPRLADINLDLQHSLVARASGDHRFLAGSRGCHAPGRAGAPEARRRSDRPLLPSPGRRGGPRRRFGTGGGLPGALCSPGFVILSMCST
jgi:hypothetical protein